MHSSIFDSLSIILKRDLMIAFRRSSTYITPLIFFLIVVTFFPLALGPQESLLSSLAPGVIWIAALLASLLAVETIFSEDFRDGTLDDFFISLEPSFILVFAKVMIHWLITGLPILVASSIAAIILYLPLDSFIPMLLSLLLGTSFMSLLGALGAALALGKSAILSAIIVLPFSVPTLLMGTSVITSSLNNQDFSGFLMIMGAMLALGIPGLCLLTVEALLLNYE
ncbi:heme exporter protein CcmB [Gammaproteobacteria bacterium]|jgi:heme exporter protein B|nr:heme exporter protein CcmB [SAR86 cluster bacterium]MDB3976667.1 heme exporter protein CcmB [Gammaproteobacteria bacterium]MDB3995207.1 heme exporter protein CcmB [Gammaproteobacteria bacterium]MDC0509590.1 heme exporter protein CcmB [Gammaproteobacteria bacterium]MDC0545516.1 heme exporter protein CcmB [Gammaproteobacteria bacterium]|tara:strand:+ start:2609 stop:3283 length:675 start_codon:yes stop_codon:yes gene_type:complete